MTKNEQAKTLVILLNLENSHVAELAKLPTATLNAMYEGYIKNAREFQFQNERMVAAEKELKMWKDIGRERKNGTK